MNFYTPKVARDLEAMARVLETSTDFRLLRRLPRLDELWLFPTPPCGPDFKLAVVDSETTGFADTDKLVEVAVTKIAIDANGQLCGADPIIEELEDPGAPLSPEIRAVTGLTDQMLAGRRFNERRLAEALGDVDAIVAHNACFDAGFWRRRFGGLNHPWICSLRDLDWPALGYMDRALPGLLAARGHFYHAHRAGADSWALAMLLAMPLSDGRTTAAHLFERAGRDTFRVHAAGARFELRHVLRARGYRWNSTKRVWTIDVEHEQLEGEQAWLRGVDVGIRPFAVTIDWYTRHTT